MRPVVATMETDGSGRGGTFLAVEEVSSEWIVGDCMVEDGRWES